MKELRISEDGVTFSSALKRIKSTSPTIKRQLITLRQSRVQVPKSMSNGQLSTSRVRITERKNLTLRQLYHQYEQDSRNEYVIRLKHDGLMRGNSTQSFDSWLGMLKHDGSKASPKTNPQLNIPQNTRGFPSDKIRREISENLLTISNKLTNKQTQATQQSINGQHSSLHTQTNYSFSHYFSQHSDLQQIKNSPQLQTVTKVSLKSSQPTYYDEVVRDETNSDDKRFQNIYQGYRQGKGKNKQNFNPNANSGHGPEGKIVGLEFSKNRRFKSTKRRRRAEK